ncbi:MAG: hypothetical protein ACREDR_31070, partial [Blastocatellia bacterium]
PAFLEGLAADPELVKDKFSSAYLVAAAARLISEVADIRAKAEKAGKRLATFALETEIGFESPRDFNAFSAELSSEILRLAAKYHHTDSPGHRKFRIFLGAHQAAKAKTEHGSEPPTDPDGNSKKRRTSKKGEKNERRNS